jgi:opacity protein-like surface antigen
LKLEERQAHFLASQHSPHDSNSFKEAMLSAMIKTRSLVAFFGLLSLAFAATSAQAQTDVALSLYGAFNGSTTGNGTQQSPANQAGGLIELRHISNPILGFEASYSFNRDNQTYSNSSVACPVNTSSCSSSTESVSANAHELTADWVPSLHIANLRPFGLAGVGLLLNVPANGQATVTTISNDCPMCGLSSLTTSTSPTQTSTKPVFVYGAGLDWGLLPHLGLRLQYRGNLYKAPDLTTVFTSTGRFTHSAEPVIGAYFRF